MSLNSGRMFDKQAATMPTAGSMQVHTLELTWLSAGCELAFSSLEGIHIQVMSEPDLERSMRATRRTISKISVLYTVSQFLMYYRIGYHD